jgi:hypothetical protein
MYALFSGFLFLVSSSSSIVVFSSHLLEHHSSRTVSHQLEVWLVWQWKSLFACRYTHHSGTGIPSFSLVFLFISSSLLLLFPSQANSYREIELIVSNAPSHAYLEIPFTIELEIRNKRFFLAAFDYCFLFHLCDRFCSGRTQDLRLLWRMDKVQSIVPFSTTSKVCLLISFFFCPPCWPALFLPLTSSSVAWCPQCWVQITHLNQSITDRYRSPTDCWSPSRLPIYRSVSMLFCYLLDGTPPLSL